MNPIRLLRESKGWTQGELVDRLDANIHTIVGWEKGAVPRPRRLIQVAAALGVAPVRLRTEIETWRQEQGKGAAA